MKRLILLSCLLGGLLAGIAAVGQEEAGEAAEASEKKPKAAVVNIQELFRNYYKVTRTQEEINHERARIQKEHNDLMGRLRSMDVGLRKLAARLQSDDLSEQDRKTLMRERGLRQQERDTLDQDRTNSVVARHGELNKKMVLRMQSLLEEIRELVAERAEKAGYDLVFDTAGLNTSQVPFLMYAKEATDITDVILEELNEDAPPGK